MSNADGLEVKVEQRDNAVLISPVGEVDLHRSPTLREQLKLAAQQRPRLLIVDLSGVPYMDSSGVATLVEAMQITRKQATDLVLCCMQDKVRSIFEIARLDSVFRIAPDVDSALGA